MSVEVLVGPQCRIGLAPTVSSIGCGIWAPAVNGCSPTRWLLLECVWPAALETAAQPFKSQTWPRRCRSSWIVTAGIWTGPRISRRGTL
jgi:hypothetical protein